MKTIVLGLFDELDDARQVLIELAGSPLDLDAIELVCEDVATQHALAAEVGLPARRGISAGLMLGAITGGVAGYFGGTTVLAAIGPLLATAGGTLLGSAAGTALGAVSETTRVPPSHRDEMEAALAEGATAIIVRTDNLPTARAIGDLFQMGGSRDLSPLEGEQNGQASAEAAFDETRFAPPAGEAETSAAARPASTDDEGMETRPAPTPPTGADTSPAPAPNARASEPEPPEPEPPEPEPSEGETLFAPPWRRGGGAQAPVPPPEPGASPIADPQPWTPQSRGEPGPTAPDPTTEPEPRIFEPQEPEPTGPQTAPEPAASPPDAPEAAAGRAPSSATTDRTTTPAPPSADTPVDALGLSARVSGALQRAGISDLAGLRERARGGEAALTALPGIGPVAVSVILNRLQQIEGAPPPSAATAARSGKPGGAPQQRPTARRERVSARDLLLDAIRGALDEDETEAPPGRETDTPASSSRVHKGKSSS